MLVNVLFYEDINPEDCDVFGVFTTKQAAVHYLKGDGWHFVPDQCIWHHDGYRGFIEILRRVYGYRLFKILNAKEQ